MNAHIKGAGGIPWSEELVMATIIAIRTAAFLVSSSSPSKVRASIPSTATSISRFRAPPSFHSPTFSSLSARCSSLNDEAAETVPAAPPSDEEKPSAAPPPPIISSINETATTMTTITAKELADGLDLRVGRILKAWTHPEADTLYVEEVDVGEPEPRTICSGLVKYIPQDHLQGRDVVVLANLKPRNMRGVKSNGMLMAASDESHENVELLSPPEGSIPGERIWFGSEDDKANQLDPATPNQIQKKKIWESVQPHLRTTDLCVAAIGEHPMRTSAGVVVCNSLKNAKIS
ncbi:hypothetical protein AMTRI_Chr06g190920 [Amborella trichopoda]